jgi:hypothetical protein
LGGRRICGRGQDGHFQSGSGHSQRTVGSVFASHEDPTSHYFDHREEKKIGGQVRCGALIFPNALSMLRLEENNRLTDIDAFCISGVSFRDK